MTALKRVVKNSTVLLGAKIFDALVGLGTIAVIARYLDVGQFGDYTFVRAFCSVIMIATNMGVANIVTREVARDQQRASVQLSAGLWLVALLSLFSCALLVIAIEFTDSSRVVKLGVYLTGLASVCLIFGDLFSAMFLAFERMEFEALKLAANQCVYLAAVLVAVNYDLGFLSLFVALLLANLVDMVLGGLIALGMFATAGLRPDLTLMRGTLSQSLPVGLRQILRKMSLRVDLLFLSFMKSRTDVAYFGSAYRLILSLRVLPSVSSAAVYPLFSRLARESKASLLEAHEGALKVILIMAVPFTVSLVVLAREVVVLIFGEAFLPASVAVQILGVSLSLTFLNTFLLMALTAADKQKWGMVSTVLCLGANVLLDLLLIPGFGYVGAALATLAAELVLCVSCLRFLGLPGMTRSLGRIFPKPLLAALAMGAGLYLLRGWSLPMALVLGSLSYVGTLFAFRTFSRQELSAIAEIGSFLKSGRRGVKFAKMGG